MTHGSLFSGIGGFDLGFERAGIKTVWQVEIDEYCRRVLARHFPYTVRFSDIRGCCGSDHENSLNCTRKHLSPVDILSGGFPCQDISNAGKRAGIDGERSGLWSEYARIIRELRPRYVVVENVAALLGRGMERVLGDLAACGYDAEWQSIRASDVGAPHRRERIWIIAYPESDRARGRIFDAWRCGFPWEDGDKGNMAYANGGSHVADSASSRRDGRAREKQSIRGRALLPARLSGRGEIAPLADADGRRREQRDTRVGRVPIFDEGNRIERNAQWATEPNVGRVAHGVPARVDRLRGLGNAIVPQIAEWIGKRIVQCEAERRQDVAGLSVAGQGRR